MKSSATGGGSVAPIFGKYYNNMIAKGIYKPTISFSFVGNVGPSNDLISTEMIDPLTGLPIEGTSTSGAAIKRENMPAEYSNTYEEGLEGFFDDTSSESKPKAQPIENKEKTDKKKKEDIDSTLDEIFSEN